jgi:hypothetical protein
MKKMYDDEDLGATRRRRPPQRGRRANVVQDINRRRQQLKAERVDQVRAKKEIVKAKLGEGLWADPVTGNVYKIRPKVLTSWTKTANTASTETRILITTAIPDGIEYMFAPLGQSENDRYNAPQLYGDIEDSSGSDITGDMSIRILSPSKIEKERIWQGNSKKCSLAADQGGLDVQKKIFFNVDTTKRAKSGDYIDVIIDTASTVCTTQTNLTIECWELERQG